MDIIAIIVSHLCVCGGVGGCVALNNFDMISPTEANICLNCESTVSYPNMRHGFLRVQLCVRALSNVREVLTFTSLVIVICLNAIPDKFMRNLRVCRGFQPLGVNVNYRRFSSRMSAVHRADGRLLLAHSFIVFSTSVLTDFGGSFLDFVCIFYIIRQLSRRQIL
jgi:hypothetical protein